MTIEPGTIDHLSQVISQVVAPSFLLGAVASFISILFSRINNVVERILRLTALEKGADSGRDLKADIIRLRRRAKLLHGASLLAIGSGIAATILIIIAFATALLSIQHVWAAAFLFIISLALLCASLIQFAREVALGLPEYDQL